MKPTLVALFPPQIPEKREKRIRGRKRRKGCNEKFVSYYKEKHQLYFCIDSQAVPSRPSVKGRVGGEVGRWEVKIVKLW
jgi:hypothetical protein